MRSKFFEIGSKVHKPNGHLRKKEEGTEIAVKLQNSLFYAQRFFMKEVHMLRDYGLRNIREKQLQLFVKYEIIKPCKYMCILMRALLFVTADQEKILP